MCSPQISLPASSDKFTFAMYQNIQPAWNSSEAYVF